MVSELYETDKERENLDPNDHYDMRIIICLLSKVLFSFVLGRLNAPLTRFQLRGGYLHHLLFPLFFSLNNDCHFHCSVSVPFAPSREWFRDGCVRDLFYSTGVVPLGNSMWRVSPLLASWDAKRCFLLFCLDRSSIEDRIATIIWTSAHWKKDRRCLHEVAEVCF